jgi:prepilin-type N-terminal cleavage/methylation domain-containing protein
MFNKSRLNNRRFKKGFTLIEFMLAVAIFVILTSLISVNARKFGTNVLITNLAHEIAVTIRQAQVYGIGARNSGAGNFSRSYGLHIDSHSLNTYILFVDLNGDNSYDTGANTATGCRPNMECLSMWRIDQENVISNFCVGNASCLSAGLVDAMDIIFKRPNPEPIVYGYLSGVKSAPNLVGSISVVSPQGIFKTVSVLASGQVSVQ